MSTATTKRCTGCRVDLPLDQFSRSVRTKSGFQFSCKDCKRVQVRDWRRRLRAEGRLIWPTGSEVRRRNPEKAAAWIAVAKAVASGRLPRVSTWPCVDCGQPAKRYDHHQGYAPEHHLDVEPVCFRCDGLRTRARGTRQPSRIRRAA